MCLIRFGDNDEEDNRFNFNGLFAFGLLRVFANLYRDWCGLIQGKSVQSLGAHAASYTIQKKTGKSPLEHVLNQKQIRTYKTTKAKLNPCEQTPELCSKINLRVAVVNKILKNKNKLKAFKVSN